MGMERIAKTSNGVQNELKPSEIFIDGMGITFVIFYNFFLFFLVQTIIKQLVAITNTCGPFRNRHVTLAHASRLPLAPPHLQRGR